MFQILTNQILTSLNIELPATDYGVNTANTMYLGNLGGTEEQEAFYCKGFVEGNENSKAFGVFSGSPQIKTFKQVTPKLFSFNLSVYSKGYNQYNTRSLRCKATGRTAEMIAALTDQNQVLVLQGELTIDSYTSKQTGEEIKQLSMFVQGFNYAGIKQPRGMSTSASFAEIPF
ncbi:MAG: hypothetical protein RLZZ171_1408 [Cyanobacteriota bacterium]|jgi:hypothetical protein